MGPNWMSLVPHVSANVPMKKGALRGEIWGTSFFPHRCLTERC